MEIDYQEDGREEPLGFALGAAARKLAKLYANALEPYPLTPSQLFLLRRLWFEDGLPLRDLGLRAQLDATSTTWLVDQLEQAKLVKRKRNDTDRRIVRVWLTDAGLQCRARLAPALLRWEYALQQRLLLSHSPDELAIFRRVLVTLIITLPEGNDLWEQLSATWDTRLDLLRSLTEMTNEKGLPINMEKVQMTNRSIEKELFIKATPERVFRALTEKDELERWFLSKGEIDLRPGGAIRFNWKPGEVDFGKILVLEPPHRLSYTLEAPGVTTITFELTAENNGTRLHLIHTGIGGGEDWDQYYNEVSNGWTMHLGNLATWLETGREKDW